VSGLSVCVQQHGPIPLDAEFDCAAGEVLALVGPSGSGKSTLLRAIAGLYHPLQGRVVVNGETWFDSTQKINLAPQQRSTGFVFQNYALFPHLSAKKNVEAAMGHLVLALRATRAKELLALVNLSGLEARRPNELSGGQQQRVAVARALARDPATLLLDEPFSAVDRATRQKLYVELAELRRQLKIPVVLVTHDLHEAAMLADRMCILRRGKTLQIGTPVEVMTRPNSAEVARLVDIKNIFEGSVVTHDHERKLTIVQWCEKTLEASYTPHFSVGAPVSWALPMEYVILHRRVQRERPSRGEHENPVSGRIAEYVMLGPNVSVGMKLESAAGPLLYMSVPTHVAHRNRLGIGEAIQVSLLAEGIHLMPWEKPRQAGIFTAPAN
jgi:molybdate transport system ATP-binding protein